MEFNEENGWVEIPSSDAERWCPKEPGDQLAGIYVDRKEDVGKNHATVYFINNTDGEFIVFGTEGLNRKFERIPLNCEVGIVFEGERNSRPPKKPFKIFKVFMRPLEGTVQDEKASSEPVVEPVTEKPKMFSSEETMNTWKIIDEIAADVDGAVNNKSIIMRARRWKSQERINQDDLDKIKKELEKNPFENRGD